MSAPSEIQRPVEITGEKIFLRDLREDDVTQDYVDWMNDPEVVRYTESRFGTHSMESVRDFVRSCAESKESILFGIFSKDDLVHLGNIKLGWVSWYHGVGDIGLIIGRKSHWGKGLATEAISLVCRYGFRDLQLKKITSGCYAPNKGSAKAFIKAGFTLEAMRRRHYRLDDDRVDGIELGLLNPDAA